MNGVISASVSAGSSHRVARVTWTAKVMVPTGCATAGPTGSIARAARRRMCRHERIMGASFRRLLQASPSDDAVPPESLDLCVPISEQLAVDLRVVLAQQGRTHHISRRVGQTHRIGGHGVLAPPGMLEV